MFTTQDVYIFMFPGIMYFWVFFIGQGPMQEILDERDAHTLGRMLASPVTVLEFLLSKMIRCFLLCALIQLVLLAASAVLFGVEWGDLRLLVPVVLVCALSVTGVLAFIYALSRTKTQAFAMCNVVIIVFGLVGGSFFPFSRLRPGLPSLPPPIPQGAWRRRSVSREI